MKSLIEYLEYLSGKIMLPESEKDKIEVSINNIKNRLKATFLDSELKEILVFGSFDRETLLSRKIDNESDVDILIVFDKKIWEQQTYLNKFKKFAEDNYSKSEIYQDHPTIVISLNHIKFELTPCVYNSSFWNGEEYKIPLKQNTGIEWKETEPYDIKNRIAKYNAEKKVLINLILLFKYWNLSNDSFYITYDIEKFVIKYFNKEKDIAINFFAIIDELHYSNKSNEQNDLNRKTKKSRNKIKILLENEMEDFALQELKKILPDIS